MLSVLSPPSNLPQNALPYRIMKFKIWVDPSLVIITIYLICLIHDGVEKYSILSCSLYD